MPLSQPLSWPIDLSLFTFEATAIWYGATFFVKSVAPSASASASASAFVFALAQRLSSVVSGLFQPREFRDRLTAKRLESIGQDDDKG